MSGKAPRDKGLRFEREIVNYLREHNIECYRVPLSGAANGFKGDVHIKIGDKLLTGEAKSRKSGFKFLYDSLGINDLLFIKQNNADPLVLMRMSGLLKYLK